MKEPNEYVDHICRNALEGWTETPPAYVGANIQKRMFWFNLWRNPAGKFSLIALCVVFISAAGYVATSACFNNTHPAENFSEISLPPESRGVSMPLAHNAVANEKMKEGPNTPASLENTQSGNAPASILKVPAVSKQARPPQQFMSKEGIRKGKEVHQSSQTSGSAPSSVKTTPQNTSASKGTEEVLPGSGTANKGTGTQLQMSNTAHFAVEALATDPQLTLNIQQIQRIPFISATGLPVSLLQSKPRHRHHPRLPMDLSLSMTPLFGNTGEKKTDLINVKTKEPSGSLSLLFQYNFKCWFFETGFQYTTIQTLQHTDQLLYNSREIQQQILTGQEVLYDTNSYWHYYFIQDSVIHVRDSVWTVEYDSTFNNIYYDSISYVYDTLNDASWNSRISLFEIPLGVGCRFYKGPMEFNLKGGIILGISSMLSGRTRVENSSAGLVSFSEYYATKKLQYSWYVSLNAILPIDEHWALMLAPDYRSSINGFTSNEGAPKRSYSAWGVGMGLRFEF